MGEIRLIIDKKLHKQLKQRALDEGVTLKILSIKALENYIKDEGKSKRSKRDTNE